MAGTYSQIFIHVVFAVQWRRNLIEPEWEERLHKYMYGILQEHGQKSIAINGMPDHVHIFFSMSTSCRLSDLVREIKKATNQFINENKLSKRPFAWQGGFGAFSYSRSQMDRVVKYILNQKEHHAEKKFRKEYMELLKRFEIDYNEKYLFDWMD